MKINYIQLIRLYNNENKLHQRTYNVNELDDRLDNNNYK